MVSIIFSGVDIYNIIVLEFLSFPYDFAENGYGSGAFDPISSRVHPAHIDHPPTLPWEPRTDAIQYVCNIGARGPADDDDDEESCTFDGEIILNPLSNSQYALGKN